MAEEADWASDLGVGPRLDDEHQAQIDLIRALEKALVEGAPRVRVGALLRSLIDTTEVHFMSEQIHMREEAYPHYAAHAREHERLLEEVKELPARVDAAGDGAVDLELVRGLQRWLRHHIRGMDRRFGEFVERPRPPPGTPTAPTPED